MMEGLAQCTSSSMKTKQNSIESKASVYLAHMKYLQLLFLLILTACGTPKEVNTADIESQIKEIMHVQEDCWNQGDVNCFMQAYWHSDSLVFIGSRGLTYGWQTTLNNYETSYPTPTEMGTLTFTIDKVEVLSSEAAYVIGGWSLDRMENNNLVGHFTLLWKRIENNWVIVADHSS